MIPCVAARRVIGPIAAGGPLAAEAGGEPETVTWAELVNCTDLGAGTVRKDSADGWNGSAAATRAIASGAGYVEFTIAGPWAHSYPLGVCDANQVAPAYPWSSGVEVSVRSYGGTAIVVYEDGIAASGYIAVAVGSVIRLAITPTSYEVLDDGAQVWTNSYAFTYPLAPCFLAYSQYSEAQGVTISGTLQASGY